MTVDGKFDSDDASEGTVTGQVDFDSHSSGIVASAVAAINVLTPGFARGREYLPPTGEELAGLVREALQPGATWSGPAPSDDDLTELGDYLARLRVAFEELTAGSLDDACAVVNDLLRDSAAMPVLARHDGEPWHLHFHPIGAPWAQSWTGSLATGIAGVLGSPTHDRLGVCSAPSCDRVYVDTSRNGTRRFCSTACQNRVKAAAFRDRNRPGHEP